jgi:serine phosphatase RsbU (regulator of sigma subunit)
MEPLRNHGRVAIARRHADEPGGDVAIVVPSWDGQLLCFLGDVTGHGKRAARLSRELETLVRELARWLPPGELLGEINNRMEAGWAPNIFASAVCLSLDAARGCGSVAVAGQLPPVVRAATTRPLSVTSGAPLGVISSQFYSDSPFELADGDVMVLVTDGVTDPLATDADALGLDALVELVQCAPRDPTEVCTRMLNATEALGSHDDATVIAIARSTWGLGHPLCSIAPW